MKKGLKRLLATVLFGVMLLGTVLTPATAAEAANETLLNTYGKTFGYSGTCVNLSQLKNANTLAHIKTQYNSITLENEMKPDAMLGYSPSLFSREDAKKAGYYVPDSMTETYVPKINFDTLDQVLKICYENGLSMRAHTLVWHSQTPDWFFRVGYSTNYGYVSASQMDARMEYYIKSVMNHVCSSKYASVVYAWDVVNEYLHATNSGWEKVYGENDNTPNFVKRAFQYAYDCLSYYGLTNSVKLFYNDFNTYMEVNDIITMINYINSGKKICAGVGMQSHLGTTYPSVDYYTSALKSFLNAGFEVQITELDVTNKDNVDQANYIYNLMKNVVTLKKNGGNITGVTIWGLSDDVTWIKGETPLLFSTLGNAKYAYYRMLEAYTDVMGSGSSSSGNNSGSSSSGNTSSGNGTVVQCENMTLSGTYAGKISSPFSGAVLYANNDACSYDQYFAYGTHSFSLRGCSNNDELARVDLYIGGVKKGTFYYGGSYPAVYTIENVTHGTGVQKIELRCTSDNGTWDVYMDYLEIK